MKRKCAYCEGKEFRRINRAGFFERSLLPVFGLYPWECVLCRRKVFLRTDGHGKSHGMNRTKANE